MYITSGRGTAGGEGGVELVTAYPLPGFKFMSKMLCPRNINLVGTPHNLLNSHKIVEMFAD